MSGSRIYPPIVGGFVEGLFAPIIELIIAVFVTALNSISSATGAPTVFWFIVLFSIMDLLRNAIACFFRARFAIGSVFGNILGIFLFYEVINMVSPEATNYSLSLVIILTISLMAGAFITAWRCVGKES